MGVTDRIRAALGNPGQQGLRSERALHARIGAQAISGNSTHKC
jgi:hypothetical protein